jgi:hypothetical protein
MYTLCTHYFLRKNQAENTGTILIPILTSTTKIWAVVCKCGGHNWSALKSDLIYFRLPAPDGSAITSRGAYFQITDVDNFITCVEMVTRAPYCINYSWLVHMHIKNPLSLRKRGVARTKSQTDRHYIRQPADASLLGSRL